MFDDDSGKHGIRKEWKSVKVIIILFMESNSKSSSLSGRISSVDVSQLDKINAIPSKTTDNILMDGLSQEDQLYLGALMDNDPSEDEEDTTPRSSAWSPMIQSPVLMDKRIKRLRPGYAVALSLEDISYIRPSWGISKGVRTIEINKKTKLQPAQVKKEKDGSNSNDSTYHYFLALLSVVILFLIVPTYLINKRRDQNRTHEYKIKLNSGAKVFELYRPNNEEQLEPIIKVQFAQGIPGDLRPDRCTCDIYNAETRRYHPEAEERNTCYSCLDWPFRANQRIYVEKNLDKQSICYHIKWQSYDALATPLIDCFLINEEQWLGLGDLQSLVWPLNRLQSDWTPIVSNLSAEFLYNNSYLAYSPNQLAVGSYVNFSLFSSNAVHLGRLNTDFEPSFKISPDPLKPGTQNRICLSVSCSDKCTNFWSRSDHLERLKFRNNILEYSICTTRDLKTLIARQFEISSREQLEISRKIEINSVAVNSINNATISARLLENEAKISSAILNETAKISPEQVETVVLPPARSKLPEGIGLIERTIFATSPEFMSALDGQTLREYVDNIVKLGLKASSILLVDSRWETYAGALKLNIAMFPKSKLLFEILHNKGFKIVFTIKPYVDTGIGVTSINQLFEAGRLYAASYEREMRFSKFGANSSRNHKIEGSLIRRKSLFTYHNESIEIGQKDTIKFPYITACKESQEGYCAVIDLTKASNRAWLVGNVMRSNVLSVEADGIQIGGAHPNSFHWNDHYREGVSELARSLFSNGIFTLPQWTGDFGYIQLAPRSCTWEGLRSVIGAVLNLGSMGFSLIHPGSVWGDLKSSQTDVAQFRSPNRMDSIYGDAVQSRLKSDEELIIRWLQVSIFLPILQFNNIAPIERHGLQELVQNLIRIRRIDVVPELKKNLPYTPLISLSKSNANSTQLALIRPVWYNLENRDSLVGDQFTIGPDILVAPILTEGSRQRDIYLPGGFWHDELRQMNLRGGKWLRNYAIDLNEIAWFSRVKR